MKRQIAYLAAVLLVASGVRVYGDYAFTEGAGKTAFAFTCFTTKVCGTATLVNSAGTEIATTTTPAVVQGAAATGAALAGNPVRVGLSDATNAQNWLAAIALADGVNGNNTGAVAPWVWNGTTWDRMIGDATHGTKVQAVSGAIASGAVASGAFASGSIASGAIASGAVASGAYAAGSLASGAAVDGWDVTQGAKADAACGTDNGTCSIAALAKRIAQNLTTLNTTAGSAVAAGTNLIGNVGQVYPAGSTPITASVTGTTAATTATLAANATLHTYICGLSIRANATAAATGNATVTGTVTGTLNFTQWTAPLASGLGVTEQVFSPCIISSATNTAIAVVSAAPGTGGVVSVTAWGFQL